MRQLANRFLNLSLTFKFVLFLLGVSVIPLLTLGIISYGTSRSVIFGEVNHYALALIDDQQTYLKLTQGAVESLIANISGLDDIKQVLVDENIHNEDYTRLATHAKIGYILNGYLNLKGLVSIDIFTFDGAHFHVGDTLNTENINHTVRQQLYQEALDSDGTIRWTGVEDNVNANSNHKKVVTAVKIFKVVDASTLLERPVGFLVVNYSVDSLYQHFSQLDLPKETSFMVIDGKNRLIYHPNKANIGSKIRSSFLDRFSNDRGSFITTVEGQEIFVTYTRAGLDDWTLVSLVPFKNLAAGTNIIWKTTISVIFISFGFISLIAYGLSTTVVAPLNQITDQFKLIPAGAFKKAARLPENRTDEIGELIRWFNVFLDSLEAKQRAEQEMVRAKESAEKANQAKSDFLANMSHELRTPLNGILGYAQILRRDQTITASQYEAVDIIEQSGQHLLTLLNDILDLSKIEAGSMELAPSHFHLLTFLKNIVDPFKIRAREKGISFTCQPFTNLPTGIRADEKRLRQVLINLLGNAIKFTERGEVMLEAYPVNGKIRFQVTDTGIGIAPEHLDEIFSPFQQVGSFSSRAEGTGLGLAISRRLVEIMGGQLAVQSKPGQGTVFWFDLELPAVNTGIELLHQDRPAILGFKGPRRKVLIVDDKWENRSVLVQLLRPLGFESFEAVNGREAIDEAQRLLPDVILMDIVMPETDGLEATRQIRALPSFRETVIIAISAGAFGEDRQRSLEAGCNEFLPKPVQFNNLLKCLQDQLGLVWIYEEKNDQAQFNQDKPVGAALVGPTPEQAAHLLDLTIKGDIKSIRQYVSELEQLDPKIRPFTTELQELAKQFRMEQIEQFLRTYNKDSRDGHRTS